MKFGYYQPNEYNGSFDYVTSSEIILKGKSTFDPKGIFSEIIWPHSNEIRFTKLAAIDLSSTGIFLQPKLYETIKNRQKKLYEGLNGTYIALDPDSNTFVESDEDNGIRGYKLLNEIIKNLDKYSKAVNPLIFEIIKNYKEKIFIQSIFVLPPSLRDIQIVEGRIQSTTPLNSAYQNLIRYSNRTSMSASKILKTNLSTVDLYKILKIQNLINEIYSYSKEMLKSKEGFIRQNVLAKRIDFSARAVIAVNPKLPLDKVQLPYKMVMKLMEPFIGHYIFKSQDNIDKFRQAAGELITEASFHKYTSKLKNGHGAKPAMDIIKAIIDKFIINKYPVLLKRDPSLHQTSWQAFEFTCTDDSVIYISPMIVQGFNADFDGDQMAATIPLTIEAQREVQEKMTNRFTRPGSGGLETPASQDIVLGMFMLTQEQNGPMSNQKYGDIDLKSLKINNQITFNTNVRYSGSLGTMQMTYGNYIYNMLFRAVLDQPYIGVVNKKVLNKHLDLARRKLSPKLFVMLTQKLVELAAYAGNLYPISIAPDELDVPADIINLKNKILEQEDYLTAESRIKKEVLPKLKKYLKSIKSGLYYMAESGARGSWSDIEQILIAKGYIADGTGKILTEPIKSSFAEGLKPQEVLQMGSAAAKGTQDRSVGTQKTGALERELVFAAQNAVIAGNNCGTTKFLEIKVESSAIASSLRYRFTKEFGLVTDDNYEKLIGKTVNVRSPIFCTDRKGICEKCYGTLWKTLKSKNVGIIAGQSIGERGTQLIMKTFHTGGKAESTADRTPYLADKYPDVSKFIKQIKQKYIAVEDMILEFDSKLISIKYTDDTLFIKDGVFKVCDANHENCIEIDFEQFDIKFGIEITIDSTMEVDNSIYRYPVSKGDSFGVLIFTQEDLSTQVKYISNLLHGQIYQDDFLKLHGQLMNIYANVGVLSAHIEIILAQMMRSKKLPAIPWRLAQTDDYIITSIKNVIFFESPTLAVGFQDISKALDYALIREQSGVPHTAGPLEKFALDQIEPDSKISDYLK